MEPIKKRLPHIRQGVELSISFQMSKEMTTPEGVCTPPTVA
jgi:hypothetical protein